MALIWSIFTWLRKFKNLLSRKAHGHDIWLLPRSKKHCGSLSKPLQMILKSPSENGIFDNEWDKVNVVFNSRIGDNNHNIKNYRYVCLLSICGNIL